MGKHIPRALSSQLAATARSIRKTRTGTLEDSMLTVYFGLKSIFRWLGESGVVAPSEEGGAHCTMQGTACVQDQVRALARMHADSKWPGYQQPH